MILKTILYTFYLLLIVVGGTALYTLYHYNSTALKKSDFGVVFGAKVWEGGVPSHSLYDRTVTGIELLKSGKVEKLIFSGGYSDTGYWETDVMKRLAIENGVSEGRIVIDRDGINSIATLKNLQKGYSYTLISNDFHLGRLRLLAYKVGLEDIQLHKSKYHYGRYLKEFYFFGREVIATLYYLFKV